MNGRLFRVEKSPTKELHIVCVKTTAGGAAHIRDTVGICETLCILQRIVDGINDGILDLKITILNMNLRISLVLRYEQESPCRGLGFAYLLIIVA